MFTIIVIIIISCISHPQTENDLDPTTFESPVVCTNVLHLLSEDVAWETKGSVWGWLCWNERPDSFLSHDEIMGKCDRNKITSKVIIYLHIASRYVPPRAIFWRWCNSTSFNKQCVQSVLLCVEVLVLSSLQRLDGWVFSRCVWVSELPTINKIER